MPPLPRGGWLAWIVAAISMAVVVYGEHIDNDALRTAGIAVFACAFVAFAYFVTRTAIASFGPNWWRGEVDGHRLPRGGWVAWIVCVIAVAVAAYGDTSGHTALSVVGVVLFLCGAAVFGYFVTQTMRNWLGPNWWRGGGGDRP